MSHEEFTDINYEEVAHNTLTDQHGESERYRRVGYFASQALRRLMDHVDPDCVVQVNGTRRAVTHNVPDNPVSNATSLYLKYDDERRRNMVLDYDRRTVGRPFDWENVSADLRHFDTIYDVAVTHAVIKVTDERIGEFLSEFIEEAMVRVDMEISTSWVTGPYYITLKSNSAPRLSVDEAERSTKESSRAAHILDYTPDHYYQPIGQGEGPKPGLGWTSRRSLDVAKIQSKHSFTGVGDVVFREKVGYEDYVDYTPEDIECELINTHSEDKPRYGAINSEELIRIVQDALFDHDSFGVTKYEWDTSQGWSETG